MALADDGLSTADVYAEPPHVGRGDPDGDELDLAGFGRTVPLLAGATDQFGAAQRGQRVGVLLGEQGSERITAGELARSRTTNSWEVVTSMSRRLPRVYDAAAGPVGIRTLIATEDRWLGSNSGTATSASSRSTRS